MNEFRDLTQRVGQIFIQIQHLQQKMLDLIFSMNNTVSIQAYVQPGQKEAEFIIERVEDLSIVTEPNAPVPVT